MKHLTVDGIIYKVQPRGGIARIFSETLPRICDLDSEIGIQLLLVGRCKWHMPCGHDRITKKPFFPISDSLLRPGRIWNPFFMFQNRPFVESKENAIWHSSYYTLPAKWNGKIVITVADMIHELFTDLFCSKADKRIRRQKKKCIDRADAVFCISHSCKEDLIRLYGIDPAKLHVIHLAASDFFCPRQNLDPILREKVPRPFLLYVGTRHHYKNTEVLYQAYKDWPGRTDYDLVLVGKPLGTRETGYIRHLGIEKGILSLTGISDEHLCQLYNMASAFIYPSLYEGFGIPLLESMQCGCPVIASDIPTSREIAGQAALFFDPRNPQELMQRFDDVLNNDTQNRLKSAGFERAEQFSWDQTAVQTLSHYNMLWNLM